MLINLLINSAPDTTTFLISINGIVTGKWENVALSSQLALAIETQTGGSHFGE